MAAPTAGTGGLLSDVQSNLNVFQLLTRSAALPVELCVRRFGTWGPRYLGLGVVPGLAWPVCFMLLYQPHPQLGWVGRFWLLMLGLLVAHNIAGVVRRARGYDPHSFYIGDSWLESVRGLRTPARARVAEVLAAAAVSLALLPVVKPLGAFLLVGTAAHAVNLLVLEVGMAARLRALRDAQIENEYVMARYRDRHRP